jgi:DivIVA domain-containing protein
VTLFFTLLTVAVLGVVAAVAAGRITVDMDDPVSSLPARGLPEGEIDATSLDGLRFSPALRGYRMEEVDEVMDRLRDELRRRDEELLLLGRLPDGEGALPRGGDLADRSFLAHPSPPTDRPDPA